MTLQLLASAGLLVFVYGFIIYKGRTNPPKNFEHLADHLKPGKLSISDEKTLESSTWIGGFLKSSNYVPRQATARAQLDGIQIKLMLVGFRAAPDIAIVVRRASTGMPHCLVIDAKSRHKPRVDISDVAVQANSEHPSHNFRYWQIADCPIPSDAKIEALSSAARAIEHLSHPGELICLELNAKHVIVLLRHKSMKVKADAMMEIIKTVRDLRSV